MSASNLLPVCAYFALSGFTIADPVTPTEPSGASAASVSPRYYWGDYDSDGLADVFLITGDGRSFLLSNTGHGGFQDITSQAGLPGNSAADEALWADFDGDGRSDLLLPSYLGQTQLLLQAPDGSFHDASLQSGIDGDLRPISTSLLDYDADGLSDLRVSTLREDFLLHNQGSGSFQRVELGIAGSLPFVSTSIRADISLQEARVLRGLSAYPPLGSGPGGSGNQALVGPGSVVSTGGGATGIAATSACAFGLDDFANPGNCISASTTPSLGDLYPLTQDLYVNPATHRVGVGTLNPIAPLAVNGHIYTSGGFVFPDFSIQTSAASDGAQGPAGPAGPAGPTGPAGADGANGADGAQGPAGPTGPAGSDGANGADGAQGPAGPAGPTGSAGSDGTNGADGAQGPAGPAGPTGPAGSDGANGADGAQGPAGPAGPTGPAGSDGANGADGAQGPAGPTGPGGAQGPSGPTGPMGPAGSAQVDSGASTTPQVSSTTSDTAMLGTDVSPDAGDYVVLLSATFDNNDTAADSVVISLYLDGLLISESVRAASAAAGESLAISTQAHVTLSAGQTLQGFWRTQGGQSHALNARSLIAMRVN